MGRPCFKVTIYQQDKNKVLIINTNRANAKGPARANVPLAFMLKDIQHLHVEHSKCAKPMRNF